MLDLFLAVTLTLHPPAPAPAPLPARGVARDEVVEEPQGGDPPARDLERLEAWPELDRETGKAVTKEVTRLRKARTDEMARQAHEVLVGLGHGAGPALLAALGKERDEDARERVAAALTAVTDARHTRLLAAEFGHKSEHVRLFALGRAAAFPDAGIRAAAEEAFAAAEERAGTKKEVERELDHAALALCSAGSIEGLDVLHARALKDWGDWGGRIRAALEAIRGPEASTRVAAHLDGGDRKATVAALRLLAGCGDKATAGPRVRPLLDSTDNSIRIAAINAARGIVDGAPPLDRMSVFEAVELAATWKRKL